VKNTFVNISGKLPAGVVDLYAVINYHTGELGIDYLVVGAMARDLVLVHGYGSAVERGTRDVDFGINVANWDEFHALKDRLLDSGFKFDPQKMHRLTRDDEAGLPWEIDIVPFGEIADEDANISWPPDQGFVMNVLGFAEAIEYALEVQVSDDPDIVIPVASPAGICVLKLVAWLDREAQLKAKDATDFEYLIRSYLKIPEIHEALYEEGHAEAQDWDEAKASAMKLGQDASRVASPETKAFLQQKLFDQPAKIEDFARDMARRGRGDLVESIELLDIFIREF